MEEKSLTLQCLVLFLACFIIFGNYYCYDLPGALNENLRNWLGEDKNTFVDHVNLLYAVYSVPNVFLPLISGWLMDVVGTRRVLQLVTTFVFVGQAVFCVGVSFRSFSVMLMGRLLFGLGGESLEVVQAKITSDWFRGRFLALALGLNITTLRLASALNDNLSPRIAAANGNSPVISVWLGLFMCGLAWLCSFLLAWLHFRYHEKGNFQTIIKGDLDDYCNDDKDLVVIVDDEDDNFDVDVDVDNHLNHRHLNHHKIPILSDGKDENQSTLSPSGNDSMPLGIRNRQNSFSAKSGNGRSSNFQRNNDRMPSSPSSSNSSPSNPLPSKSSLWATLASFPWSFYHLSLIVVLLYGVIVPFGHIISGFLQFKYLQGMDDAGKNEMAGSYMSIPDIVSAILAPILGYLIDLQVSSSANNNTSKAVGKKSKGSSDNLLNLSTSDSFMSTSPATSSLSPSSSSFSRAEHSPLLVSHNETLDLDQDVKHSAKAAWLIGRWMPVAGLGLCMVHLCFAFVSANVIPAPPLLIMLGIFFSLLTSVLWPIVPWIVPQKHSGTAYGISSVSLNISLAIFPVIISKIYERADYLGVEIFLVVLASSGTLLAVSFARSRWLDAKSIQGRPS